MGCQQNLDMISSLKPELAPTTIQQDKNGPPVLVIRLPETDSHVKGTQIEMPACEMSNNGPLLWLSSTK